MHALDDVAVVEYSRFVSLWSPGSGEVLSCGWLSDAMCADTELERLHLTWVAAYKDLHKATLAWEDVPTHARLVESRR